MTQLVTPTIKEFHASPWVLPNEPFLTWIKWTDENIDTVTMSIDSDIVIHNFFNTEEHDCVKTNEIKIDVKKLEVPGFFGFEARYAKLPSYELDIEITEKLFDD